MFAAGCAAAAAAAADAAGAAGAAMPGFISSPRAFLKTNRSTGSAALFFWGF